MVAHTHLILGGSVLMLLSHGCTRPPAPVAAHDYNPATFAYIPDAAPVTAAIAARQPPPVPRSHPPKAKTLPPAPPTVPAVPAVPKVPAVPGHAPAPQKKPALVAQPYQQPLPAFRKAAPASRYANLSPQQCRDALKTRQLPVSRIKGSPRGVATAVRIEGPMGEVRYVSGRAPSPFGILDCRLALVLQDMAAVVAPLGVREIHIGSMLRGGAKIAGRKVTSQHAYGLAMDITALRMEDGSLVRVEQDWHAHIGDTPCGPKAIMHEPSSESMALRNFVCAVASAQLFHHMLTPSANRAHRDHLHFDIKRGAGYQSLR